MKNRISFFILFIVAVLVSIYLFSSSDKVVTEDVYGSENIQEHKLKEAKDKVKDKVTVNSVRTLLGKVKESHRVSDYIEDQKNDYSLEKARLLHLEIKSGVLKTSIKELKSLVGSKYIDLCLLSSLLLEEHAPEIIPTLFLNSKVNEKCSVKVFPHVFLSTPEDNEFFEQIFLPLIETSSFSTVISLLEEMTFYEINNQKLKIIENSLCSLSSRYQNKGIWSIIQKKYFELSGGVQRLQCLDE